MDPKAELKGEPKVETKETKVDPKAELKGELREMRMEDFYATIKEISKKKHELPSDKDLLEKHKSEVFNVIINNYKINIQNAVNSGSNIAYLCLYIPTAKINDVVHIRDILEETETIKQKNSLYQVTSAMEDLQKFFNPFKLQITKPDENFDVSALTLTWI